MQKIQVPGVSTVQTLAFGGEKLDILFVTTTGTPFSLYTGKPYADIIAPGAMGLLHKITGLGVKGRPHKKLPQKFATVAYMNILHLLLQLLNLFTVF